jgi:hypothetical protein
LSCIGGVALAPPVGADGVAEFRGLHSGEREADEADQLVVGGDGEVVLSA